MVAWLVCLFPAAVTIFTRRRIHNSLQAIVVVWRH